VLQYLINRYKLDRRVIFKLGLKVTLGVPHSSAKEVEHFGLFGGEMVVVDLEFSLYLDPLVLKGRVYPIRQ